MVESRPLVGIPGNLALWRLLGLRGVQLPLQALEETLLWDFSLEAMVLDLRARGMAARGVVTAAEDLAHLPLPTLAQVQTGDWLVLLEREGDRILFEQGLDGPEWISRAELTPALTGVALEMATPLPASGGFWARAGAALAPARLDMRRVVLAVFLLQALALVGPWVTRAAVDEALPSGARSTLAVLAIGLVLVQVFRSATGILKDLALASITARFDAGLQMGLMEHFLALPFRKAQGWSSGVLSQAFGALESARSVLLASGAGAILSLLTAFVYLAWMVVLRPSLGAGVALAGLALGLASALFGQILARARHAEVKAQQAQQTALAETLRGIQTLKAAALEGWAEHRWSRRLGTAVEGTLRRDQRSLIFSVASEVLVQGAGALILLWGAADVLAGKLSLGTLLAFTQMATAFLGEAGAMGQALVSYRAWRPTLADAEAVFAAERRVMPPRKGVVFAALPVVLQDVWFRYEPDRPWVIQSLSLTVPAGAIHHLGGPSGSGKSTLLRLVAGLYGPERGSLSIGGHDPSVAQALVAYLPQFPTLMTGNIWDNLRLFSNGAPRGKLIAAAKETGLDAWATTLPMGYHTVTVLGGQNLSGGQRQLIALTGVLASGKRILLLDEALSNLDWIARRRITMSGLLRDRTVIYASHEEVFGS